MDAGAGLSATSRGTLNQIKSILALSGLHSRNLTSFKRADATNPVAVLRRAESAGDWAISDIVVVHIVLVLACCASQCGGAW